MDIRSFFNRSAARKSPNAGIKDKLATPERKNSFNESLRSLKENEVVERDSKVLRKKTAPVITPSITENIKKRKSAPVPMSSDSDAENPIPSKLAKPRKNDKIENGNNRPKSTKKRILIDDSDLSDGGAVTEEPVNSYTKIQKRSEKSKTQLPVTVVEKKKKRDKDNILPVVEIASNSEESDDGTTIKRYRKQSQYHALKCGLLKENVAKMLKKQQSLDIETVRKGEKEGGQRRKINEHEQFKKSNKREETRKNSTDEHPLVKLNPISVSDFFGGTKIKSRNLDDRKKLAECKKKEKCEDDSFGDALEQAEADLLSPASTLKHSALVTPVKKKSNEEHDANTSDDEEFKQKNPRKSPRIASNKQNAALNVTQSRSKIEDDDKISPLKLVGAEKQVQVPVQVEKKFSMLETSHKKQVLSVTSLKTLCPSIASSSQLSQISLKSSQQTPSDSFAQFVDRYKPKSVKQIIGQQGEKSCVNKLLNWLKNWNAWHVTKTKEKSHG
uniref:Uncharacterized protein n=1 Tax=Romanomermis culicivorax TaxID=13658 RepID=A0A915IUK5_ROMCU